MNPANAYRMPCYACDGAGGKRTIIPHPGEAVAADIWEDLCEECDGTGECDELFCSSCDAPVPDDGKCEDCAELDRGWATVPDSPSAAFGSAINGRYANAIATPPLITERPRRFTDPALRGPPCPVCGDDGPHFCDCGEE